MKRIKGLVSLKCERSYVHHGVVEDSLQRGLAEDWWAIVTPATVETDLRRRRGPYRKLWSFSEFMALGGDPRLDDVNEIERRYGAPLWNAVVPDRRLYSPDRRAFAANPSFRGYRHEELIRIVGRAFRAAERVLDRTRADVVLLEGGASVDEQALYRVAHARGIPTLFLTDARVRNRWFLAADPFGQSPAIRDGARALRDGEAPPPTPDERAFAETVLRGIRERSERPASYAPAMQFIEQNAQLQPGRVLRFPLRAAESVLGYSRSAARDNPYIPDPRRQLPERLALRWRVLRDRFVTRWDRPVDGERYVYLPLQMQPEGTTSIFAPAFLDQLALTEIVARSIPLTWKLYVKENPAMWGCRSRVYYARLRGIPNVRLLRPTEPSHPLTARARLLLTITGTAAWEAAVMGTPAIKLAPTVFEGVEGIATFRQSMTDLPEFISGVLAGRHLRGEFSPTDYIVSVLRNTFAADHITYGRHPDGVPPEETRQLVDAMMAAIAVRRSPGASEQQLVAASR